MLKSNAEAFKKEASAASEKSRSLQVAYSKTQATLDSTSQVTYKKNFFLNISYYFLLSLNIDMNIIDLHIHCVVVTYLIDLSSRSLIFSSLLNSIGYKELNFFSRNINTMQINCP